MYELPSTLFPEPTPGAQELFQAVFADEYALGLFEAATGLLDGRVLVDKKLEFIDYVTETYGLSADEAAEIFFRLEIRKANGDGEA